MAKATYSVRKLETAPFDKRVVERHISAGSIGHKDLAKHLKELDDSADNSEEITVSLEEEEAENQEVEDNADEA
ncbi:MAG: hypothetical protein CMP23_04945 [Rickettsiales bacterium]|nr:hypothetical protein [Rickettsiales bacterium]|tara:strand:- start:2524 stop:2745 length:222 start_codon:yes stop_codon:yes gene_type:complete